MLCVCAYVFVCCVYVCVCREMLRIRTVACTLFVCFVFWGWRCCFLLKARAEQFDNLDQFRWLADLGLNRRLKFYLWPSFHALRALGTLVPCTRVRIHARTLKSVKAAKPPWNAQAAKPQSRHGTRKPQSRKVAKLPWNAQAAKPQSFRAASSATHVPPPAFIAAALPPPWIAEAAKPQSRKAASSETQAPSPVFIAAVLPERQEVSKSRKAPRRRSTTKRQSFKKRQSVKKRQSFKSRSGTAPKRQRAANERLAVLRRGRACLRKEVCNQRLAVFRRGRACILRDNS